MKFQAAIATALATECLSSSIFGVEAKATDLSEIKKRQLEVIQSISKINANDGKKTRILKKAIANRQRKRRLSTPQLSNQGKVNSAPNSAGLDLGILGSAATDPKEATPKSMNGVTEDSFSFGRRMEEVDPAYLEDTIEYLKNFIANPLSYSIQYGCEMLEYYDSCTTCEVVNVVDTVTGEPTGEYNVLMDCPNLPETYNAAYFAGLFNRVCEQNYFCDGCVPVCPRCSIDEAASRFAGNDCIITDDIRVAMGLDEQQAYLDEIIATLEELQEIEVELEEVEEIVDELTGDGPLTGDKLEEIEELIEGLTSGPVADGPWASTVSYACDFLNESSYCSTCSVTDILDATGAATGSYNIVFDCPNLPVFFQDPSEMFTSLQEACDANLCADCNINQEKLFMDLENCNINNLIPDEPVDAPDETIDAQPETSGGHSSRSTFLTLMLVGASWCWLAA